MHNDQKCVLRKYRVSFRVLLNSPNLLNECLLLFMSNTFILPVPCHVLGVEFNDKTWTENV